MHTIKVNKFLLYIINPALLLLGLITFCYFSKQILTLQIIFWILPIFAVGLIFARAGNYRLTNADIETKHVPWQSWFCTIALLELSIFLAYLGITSLCGDFFTVNTTKHPALFETTLKTLLIHDGLFPWALYAVIGAGMAYTSYHDHEDSYLSNLFKSIANFAPQSPLGLIANIGMRRCVLFAIATIIVCTALLLGNFFLPIHLTITYGFSTPTILTTLTLLVFTFSETVKEYVIRLFSRQIPTYLSLPVFCIILAGVSMLLSTVYKEMYPNVTTTPPALANAWIQYDWQTGWMIFTLLWFLCLTPLVGSIIARLSHGYSVRQIIIGVMILPVVLTLFFMSHDPIIFTGKVHELTIQIISVIGLFVLLPLLLNHHHLSDTIMAYFPKNGINKHRDHHLFVTELLRTIVVALYCYLTIGVNGLALLIYAPNWLCILTLPFTALTITWGFFKKHS